MGKFCFVVFTTPTVDADEEFNTWYDVQHLRDVLRIPGFLSAQRLRIPDGTPDMPDRYLALYQIETDDAEGCLNQLRNVAGSSAMPLSPALDLAKVRTVLCPVIAELARNCDESDSPNGLEGKST